jgi:hypothetical protein
MIFYLRYSFTDYHPSPRLPAPRVNVLWNGHYDECEGKDAANYTLWGEFTEDLVADITQTDLWDNQLVQCGPNGQRAVNLLRNLARSVLPAGAYTQVEALSLATTGPLQGKYVYEKVIHLALAYLSRFSSVLGYSYVTSKAANLLISDTLDLGVLIAPTGAYEAFKRGCNTQCRGRVWIVA